MTRKPFKVGQRVWSLFHGWGEVTGVADEIFDYPVQCKFQSIVTTFTKDGRALTDCKRPTLFHNEIPIDQWPDPDPPLPDLAVDTPVWVRVTNGPQWSARHFAEWSDGEMLVFGDGVTSHSNLTQCRSLVRVAEWSLTKPEDA